MAIVSKDELMLYCKVDEGDPREDLLVELAETAEADLLDGGATYTDHNALRFKLTVKMMTLHYLDNPAGAPFPAGIQRRINELKFGKSAQ